MPQLPTVTRTYRTWFLDSTRWKHIPMRDGDVVVTTPYKSGTTWMQQIAGQLIFNDLTLRPNGDFGRWIDAAFAPIEEEAADLAAMAHRRVFKTHLPLDGLPYDPMVRYIYVGRDLRDVFMSLWNHHSNYTPEIWEMMTGIAARHNVPMPERPTDILSFWREWATRGYAVGDADGYPYWSATDHLRTWWAFRHLPNVMFVHFNDLLADLPGEITRIADFLGTPLPAGRAAQIAGLVNFASMKKGADIVNPGAHFGFVGGPATFINKGTNGRWRDVLGPKELELYAPLMQRLPPDAARWLQQGREAAVNAA